MKVAASLLRRRCARRLRVDIAHHLKSGAIESPLDSSRAVAKYSARVRARRFFPVAGLGPAALPLLALALGCATSGTKRAAPVHADRGRAVATVVFAAPPRSTVWLYQGVDDGAGWTCEGAGEMVQVASEGGFVVAKLPARTGKEKYAIGEITIADGPDRRLRSGANAKVPVFNAVPGKVTHVGGVKVLDVGEGLSLLPDPSATRARAARVLARKDRRLAATLAKGKTVKAEKMSWVAMPDSCARH
jgi:hypothetical protein